MDKKQITYSVSFALRRGTALDLYTVNETPKAGEPIIETDTLKIKIGDGEHPYNELNYVGAEELSTLEVDITKLQEQLNAFFASAEIGDAAIDTLVEIQKILDDSSVNIQELLVKINEFEALHENIDALIAQIESDYKAADTAIEGRISALIQSYDEALNFAEADRAAIREDTDSAIAELETAIGDLESKHDQDLANLNAKNDEFTTQSANGLLALDTKISNVELNADLRMSAIEEAHAADMEFFRDELSAKDEIITNSTSGVFALQQELAIHQMESLEQFGELGVKDTELSNGLAAETTRAKGIETELANRLQNIEIDYLRQADKNELNASIGGVSNVANAAKAAIDAFLNENAISEGAVDTLKEIQAELEAGEVNAAAILKRVGDLETKHANEIEVVRNEHKTDKDDLSNAINEIASQSETTFERFEEKHNEDITAVQKDIADMQTLVAEQISNDIAGLRSELDELSANITDNISVELAKTKTDFETADTTIRNEMSAEFATVRAEMLADKTALTEAHAADIAAVNEAINAIPSDYLVEADKIELDSKIIATQDIATYAKETIDAFLNDNTTSDGVVNTLKEIQAGLDAGEISAASLAADINLLKQADIDINTTITNEIATVNETINTKTSAVETNTKAYADELNTAMDTRVKVCEDTISTLPQNFADIRAEFAAANESQTTALNSTIDNAINDINASIEEITDDYLTSADKIAVLNEIATEAGRATGVEVGLDNRIHAIEIDYLKYTDKAEVKNLAIEANAAAIEAKNAVNALLADAEATENIVNTLRALQESLDAGDETSAAALLANIVALQDTHEADKAAINAEISRVDQELRNEFNISDQTTNGEDHRAMQAAIAEINATLPTMEANLRNEFAAADTELTNANTEAHNTITANLNAEIARAKAAEAQALTDAKTYADTVKSDILGHSDVIEGTFDTLKEINTWITTSGVDTQNLTSAIAGEAKSREDADAALDERVTYNRGKIDELIAIFPPYVEEQLNLRETKIIAYFDEQLGEIINGAY